MIRITQIRPVTSFLHLNLQEIWLFKDLLYIFTWRDIKVRYKQTFFGVAWVIFQPIMTTLVFTFFFGKLSNIPSADLPYSLFVFSGLVFWNYFQHTLISASNSMVENESIIKKVYFPKIILPLSSVLTCSVDFSINLILLLVFAIYLGYIPQLSALLVIPLAGLFTAFTAVGSGLFFSALNVKYRDVRYILPFFFQILMFLTPVIYSLDIVSGRNQSIMALNPMTAVVESVRQIFSSNPNFNPLIIGISSVSACLIFLVGIWYFNRSESYFADVI